MRRCPIWRPGQPRPTQSISTRREERRGLQRKRMKAKQRGGELETVLIFLGKVLQPFFCEKMFGVSRPVDVDENLTDVPELDNEDSERWESTRVQ